MNRLALLKFTFLLIGILISLRLFYLQVLKHDYYTALAEGQHWLQRKIPAVRGEIFSADGFPLATNEDAYLIYAIPPEIKEAKEIAKLIVDVLKNEEKGLKGEVEKENSNAAAEDKIKEINELLEMKDRLWVPLAHTVSAQKTEQIKKLNLPGIYFEVEKKRAYPEGALAAHVLGFVGKNDLGEDQGYYGLEGFYNRELAGQAGFAKLEKDASGKPIPVGESNVLNPQNGRNLYLTLNRELQYFLEKKLEEGVKKYGAEDGTVILMEPQTGKILALANFPTFGVGDWTNYLKGENDVSRVEVFRDIAIQSSYEPGSVLKTFTMSASLQEGVVTPQTTYNDTSPKEYSGHLIHTWDDKYHGVIDMAQILQLSNNTGAAWVGTQLGFKKFSEYLKKFHLGEPLGIDLQGEAQGIIRDEREWRDIDLANMSFGQGISVTPLQMLSIVATIANNGVQMKPFLVEKIVEPQGLSKKDTKPKEVLIKPQVLGRPISSETAKMMKAMLKSVIDKGEFKWFVKNAGLDQFSLAGKTGTAQIPEGGRYTNKTQVTFVGFAPVDKPQFVMLLKMTHPTASSYSAETAVPLWLEMAKGLMLHFGITPEK